MTQLSAKDSKKKGKHARVMILLGGSTLDLARHPDLLSQFDVRIVVDVDDELRRVCPNPVAADVIRNFV